jgi:hypothetical protein
MTKQRKQMKVSLFKILKIIELLDEFKDYQISEEIYKNIASILGHELKNSEIEDYSIWYLSEDADVMGYDKQNYENAISILENFRKDYCISN